ncbi:MAG: ABC transporter ATP-binding protein [Acidobacteria bacterium]|nr:ABC transporter ATP-binding protein [Acidobacteriota bacterium]
MSLLSIHDVSYSYPGRPAALTGMTATVTRPEVIAIAGPNGAGKSTLLDILAGQKAPTSGSCRIQGEEIQSMDRKDLCRRVAHIPQTIPADVPFTMEEVILTGRIPYGRGLYENEDDMAAMEEAIRSARLDTFRGRPFSGLSGGEKQRVLVAAALCQQSKILLLDEPGAHLDPENEAQLWELLTDLRDSGHLVLVVTHHLALAAQNANRIWLLDGGRLVADAGPLEAMRPDALEHVFHVPFHWHQSAEGRVFLTYGR